MIAQTARHMKSRVPKMPSRRPVALPLVLCLFCPLMADETQSQSAAVAIFDGSATVTADSSNGRIAFQSDRAGDDDIWTIEPDGSGLINLTDNPADDETPAWSPDGTRIAFSNYTGIAVADADGENFVQLTTTRIPGSNYDQDPAWSPDGEQIVFTRPAGFFNPHYDLGNSLCVIDRDGGDVRILTDNFGDESNDIYDVAPAWSPQLGIATPVVRGAVADAFVRGADAERNTNYGASTEMQVKRTLNPGAGRGRRGFLRFDTSSIGGTISSARLRIYARLTVADLPPTDMIIQKVTDTAWDEMAMTWNNQPVVESPTALAQITVVDSQAAWYDFDLTSFIQQERAAGRTAVSFRLINLQPTGNSGVFYTSVATKEDSAHAPQLVVTP